MIQGWKSRKERIRDIISSNRFRIGLLVAILMGSFSPTLERLYDVQMLYATILGSLILSLLFMDRVFDQIRRSKDPRAYFGALKRYYVDVTQHNFYLFLWFMAGYLNSHAFWKTVSGWTSLEDQPILVDMMSWLWFAIYGYLAGFISYGFYQLTGLLIRLRLSAENSQNGIQHSDAVEPWIAGEKRGTCPVDKDSVDRESKIHQ